MSATTTTICAASGTTMTLPLSEAGAKHYTCPTCGKPLTIPKRREEDDSETTFNIRKHTEKEDDGSSAWPFPVGVGDDDTDEEDAA